MKYFLSFLIIINIFFQVSLVHAQQFYVDNRTTKLDSQNNTFEVVYSFSRAPSQVVNFYLWFGEDGTDVSNWNRSNLLGTLRPNTPLPATLGYVFDFQKLGLIRGKTYGYILADRTQPTGATYFAESGTDIKKCFSPEKGSIPCDGNQSSQNTPAPNNPSPTPSSPSGTPQSLPLDVRVEQLSTGEITFFVEIKPPFTENNISDKLRVIYGPLASSLVYTQDLSPTDATKKEWSAEIPQKFSGNIYYRIVDGSTFLHPFGQTSAPAVYTQAQFVGTCHDQTNNKELASKPTTVLCSSGNPSSVIDTATGWSWKCQGSPGTSPASCSATKKTGNNSNSSSTPPSSGNSSGNNQPSSQTPSQEQLPNNFLKNPLPYKTFPEIMKAVVNNIVLPVAVPFIGIMIIYSGFLFVVARNNGSLATYAQAKTTLKYTLIGAALILGAFVIANALQATLNALVN